MSRKVRPADSVLKISGCALAAKQVESLCVNRDDSWIKDSFAQFLCDAFLHPGRVSKPREDEIFSGKFSAEKMREASRKIGTSADRFSVVSQVRKRSNDLATEDPAAMRFLNNFSWWLEDKAYLLNLAAGNRERESEAASVWGKIGMTIKSVPIARNSDPAVTRPSIPDGITLDDLLLGIRLDLIAEGLSKARLAELERRLAALKSGHGTGGDDHHGRGGRGGGGGGGGSAVASAGRKVAPVDELFADLARLPDAPTSPLPPAPAAAATRRQAVAIAVPVASRGGGNRGASSH